MAVIDTNFLIALEKGDASALRWLEENRQDEHHVPDFVAVEYLTRHTSPDAAFEALAAGFTIAHGTPAWIRSATRLRRDLHARRARFRAPDFWIAAWAHHLEAPVVTRNGTHFRGFGIGIATW